MTRVEANRILDAARFQRDSSAQPSEALITRALLATGDLGPPDVLTWFYAANDDETKEVA
jgi:hypothetical protein